MNYILMDIKKFLKKLETGQMEIEAGQWELHKDITNLKNTIQELKQLKKDLQIMKQYGLRQTDLIKNLQIKLKGISEMKNTDNEGWSFSSSSIQGFENNSFEPVTKVRKKMNSHSKIVLRSGKTLGCTSHDSIPKKQALEPKSKNEKAICMSRETRQKDQDDSSQSFASKKAHKFSSPNHNILQRYLQDSARYIDQEAPQMSCLSSRKSSQDRSSETVEEDSRSNCDPAKSNLDQQKQTEAGICVKNKKKFHCSDCPKKLECKNHFRRLQKHKKTKPLHSCNVCNKCFYCKNRLKKHEKVHEKMTKCFRGYRCSYCDKICGSPEELTAHLKGCRIITKAHVK